MTKYIRVKYKANPAKENCEFHDCEGLMKFSSMLLSPVCNARRWILTNSTGLLYSNSTGLFHHGEELGQDPSCYVCNTDFPVNKLKKKASPSVLYMLRVLASAIPLASFFNKFRAL